VSGGGIEMGGELGDLVAEAIQLRDRRDGQAGDTKVGVHRRVSFFLRRLYTPTFGPP